MAKKLFVRFATTSDEKDVFDFYASNQHEFVFQRNPDVWKERIASGAVTIIQDEDGKIVASTIAYPITQNHSDGTETHEWTELGSTRVTLDGIGLAKVLITAQVLRAYLLEPPNDRFVSEIVIGNEHSKHVYTKNGATPFDIPPGLHEKVKATVAPDSGCAPVEWFQIGVEVLPSYAASILDYQANPIIKNKRTGEEYELDFSKCTLVTLFEDAVKDLAGQDYGDVKKPNLKHGVRMFRDKFNP